MKCPVYMEIEKEKRRRYYQNKKKERLKKSKEYYQNTKKDYRKIKAKEIKKIIRDINNKRDLEKVSSGVWRCSRCRLTLDIDSCFEKDTSRRFGFRKTCIFCLKKYRKKYSQKIGFKEKRREYYKTLSEEQKKKKREKSREYYSKNMERERERSRNLWASGKLTKSRKIWEEKNIEKVRKYKSDYKKRHVWV